MSYKFKACCIPFLRGSHEDAVNWRDRLESEVCTITRGDHTKLEFDNVDGEGWYVLLYTLNITGMVADLTEKGLI